MNGNVAIEGPLPVDANGMSTGTLHGAYAGAKLSADCSSQRKTDDWVELRCRIIIDGEQGPALVM